MQHCAHLLVLVDKCCIFRNENVRLTVSQQSIVKITIDYSLSDWSPIVGGRQSEQRVSKCPLFLMTRLSCQQRHG